MSHRLRIDTLGIDVRRQGQAVRLAMGLRHFLSSGHESAFEGFRREMVGHKADRTLRESMDSGTLDSEVHRQGQVDSA
ncbi:MAG: hypothetical protein IPK83_25095 [Planctomycetes bacterium]|nr:hypothetical protein [Planctomycetota bacterium]